MTQWGLDTLFNPAKRHMDDEKRRLQATREEAGDSSGGKRIDLASGKVRIQRTDAAADEDTDGTDGTGEAPAAGKSADTTAAQKPKAPAPSAAAKRAAQRRGRSV